MVCWRDIGWGGILTYRNCLESDRIDLDPNRAAWAKSTVAIFAGAGGLSLGFAMAGLAPSVSVDIDGDACSTYEVNHGRAIQADLLSLEPEVLLKEARLVRGQTYVLLGGPPCQGFSSAGGKDPEDPRNRLIFRYLEYLDALAPRWFVFENVEGLLTSNRGRSIYELVREFIELGYSVRLEKLNAACYGVPQSRKRVLLVGNRLGLNFQFPAATHWFTSGRDHHHGPAQERCPSFVDAVGDLPFPVPEYGEAPYAASPKTAFQKWVRTGSDQVTFHWVRQPSEVDRRRFALLHPGQTMRDLPETLWHPSYARRANRRVRDGTPTERRGGSPAGLKRLVADEPAKTITGSAPFEFIHPLQDRRLSLRECARLQSFPDRYRFAGSSRSVAQQIGNAVPPLFARAIAEHVLRIDRLPSTVTQARSAGGLLGFRLTNAEAMSPALAHAHKLLLSLTDQPQPISLFAAEDGV